MRPNFSTLRTKIAVAITTLALVIAGTLIAAPAQAGFFVTGITPTSGQPTGGTLVVMSNSGWSYAGVGRVTFGGADATIVEAGAQLKVTTPAHAPGPVNIVLYDHSGFALETEPNAFTYTAAQPLSPVTLTGASNAPLKATLTAGAPSGSKVVFSQLMNNTSWRQIGTFASTGAPIVKTFNAAAGVQRYRAVASKTGTLSVIRGVDITVKKPSVLLAISGRSNSEKRATFTYKATSGATVVIYRINAGKFQSAYSATATSKTMSATIAAASGIQTFKVAASKTGMLTTIKSVNVKVK